MTEQIKMLLGMNTAGGSWNVVLDGDPDSLSQQWGGEVGGKFCPL